MPPLAKLGILPGVDVSLAISLGKLSDAAEVLVIATLLAGHQNMHRMMEVIIPLRMQAIAIRSSRQYETRVVQVALSDQIYFAFSFFR